jgi:hypothetical protein
VAGCSSEAGYSDGPVRDVIAGAKDAIQRLLASGNSLRSFLLSAVGLEEKFQEMLQYEAETLLDIIQ